MTVQNNKPAATSKNAALFWMLFPVALLVVSVSGWLVMVKIAVDDPGFSVEQDYYKKAANYDDEIARRASNAALGLQSQVVSFALETDNAATLVIRLLDRDGQPASDYAIQAQAFPVARGNAVQLLQFKAQGGGVYQSSALSPRPGLWELRVVASKDGQQFTQTLRTELFAGMAKGDPS